MSLLSESDHHVNKGYHGDKTITPTLKKSLDADGQEISSTCFEPK